MNNDIEILPEIKQIIGSLLFASKEPLNLIQIKKAINETGKILSGVYKQYSKVIPYVGKAIVGKKEPYEYLTKSISEFVNQDELIELMKKNNFQNCNYRNLSGGIVAIHSGWKI